MTSTAAGLDFPGHAHSTSSGSTSNSSVRRKNGSRESNKRSQKSRLEKKDLSKRNMFRMKWRVLLFCIRAAQWLAKAEIAVLKRCKTVLWKLNTATTLFEIEAPGGSLSLLSYKCKSQQMESIPIISTQEDPLLLTNRANDNDASDVRLAVGFGSTRRLAYTWQSPKTNVTSFPSVLSCKQWALARRRDSVPSSLTLQNHSNKSRMAFDTTYESSDEDSNKINVREVNNSRSKRIGRTRTLRSGHDPTKPMYYNFLCRVDEECELEDERISATVRRQRTLSDTCSSNVNRERLSSESPKRDGDLESDDVPLVWKVREDDLFGFDIEKYKSQFVRKIGEGATSEVYVAEVDNLVDFNFIQRLPPINQHEDYFNLGLSSKTDVRLHAGGDSSDSLQSLVELSEDSNLIAVKVVNKGMEFLRDPTLSRAMRDELLRRRRKRVMRVKTEIALLSSLASSTNQHSYFTEMLFSFETTDHFILGLQFCPGRNLHWLMMKNFLWNRSNSNCVQLKFQDPTKLYLKSPEFSEVQKCFRDAECGCGIESFCNLFYSDILTATMDLDDGKVPIVNEYSSTSPEQNCSKKLLRTRKDLIRKRAFGLPLHIVKFVFYQILQALAVLHQNNIVFRDLKPQNILLMSDGKIKLCDFGVSQKGDITFVMPSNRDIGKKQPIYSPSKYKILKLRTISFVGTVEYMAPEMISGDIQTSKMDVFQAGIVAYEMFYGFSPFNPNFDPPKKGTEKLFTLSSCAKERLYSRILNCDKCVQYFPITDNETRKFIKLLRAILTRSLARRLSEHEALEQSFFNGSVGLGLLKRGQISDVDAQFGYTKDVVCKLLRFNGGIGDINGHNRNSSSRALKSTTVSDLLHPAKLLSFVSKLMNGKP